MTKTTPRIDDPKRISVCQVDAFTETPMCGNPAGVVTSAAGLRDQHMQAIAREMSLSETAFVLPPTRPEADLRIRWFTPTAEVPLCGHATIAAFHALAEQNMHGMMNDGVHEFRLETASGILAVSVEKRDGSIVVLFGLPLPTFSRASQHKLDVMRVLNLSLDDFENRLPIVATDHLFVPIRRLHTVFALKPNFFAMSQFLTNRGLSGLCVFSTETVERESAVHSRFFAPNIGIPEDPVTGSSNGPLGVYLFEQGQCKAGGSLVSVVGEQGDAIGRKGRVTVQMDVEAGRVKNLRIGGRAVTVLSGQMTIA